MREDDIPSYKKKDKGGKLSGMGELKSLRTPEMEARARSINHLIMSRAESRRKDTT